MDGVLWRPADAVDAGSAGAQTYVLDTAADGTASIRFGDGRSGAKPPDASEVRATYRSGGGAVTLTLHWPPAADFRELAARIGEDGLSLRLAGRAAAAR